MQYQVFDKASGMFVCPAGVLDPDDPYCFETYSEALYAKMEILAANGMKASEAIEIQPYNPDRVDWAFVVVVVAWSTFMAWLGMQFMRWWMSKGGSPL